MKRNLEDILQGAKKIMNETDRHFDATGKKRKNVKPAPPQQQTRKLSRNKNMPKAIMESFRNSPSKINEMPDALTQMKHNKEQLGYTQDSTMQPQPTQRQNIQENHQHPQIDEFTFRKIIREELSFISNKEEMGDLSDKVSNLQSTVDSMVTERNMLKEALKNHKGNKIQLIIGDTLYDITGKVEPYKIRKKKSS